MSIQTKYKSRQETEIAARVWGIVNALPHRAAIIESDARYWVEEVVKLHGEAAVWHAIRLNGFGGSEIGVLVRNMGGVRADHQASAHDIVAGKLMRKVPSETSAPMTRGHENEEPHARRFYAKYGATRDIDAYEALKSAQGKRPWMRYSPDDLVSMPVQMVQDAAGAWYPSQNQRDGQARRWLIDYKAPSQVEQGESIAFQYACQLSQGAILCAEAGIDLDGMMLSQFDWANWTLKDDVVAWDQNMGELVLQSGDHYWEYVQRGKVPDYIRTPEASGLEEYKDQHITAAEMIATLSALADASKKRSDEIREQILLPIKGQRLAGQKVSFGMEGAPVLTLGVRNLLDREAAKKLFTPAELDACSGKNVYDPKAMEDYLRASGADMAPFRVRDLDANKVFALAAQKGLDAEALMVEQLTMSPAASIKQKMAQYINEHYPLSAAMAQRDANARTSEALEYEEPVQTDAPGA